MRASFARFTFLLRSTALWVVQLPVISTTSGTLLNQIVLFANHGKFPVSVNARRAAKDADSDGMLDGDHCVMTPQTHLNLLADVFDFKSETESVGDLLIDFGYWSWGFAPFVWGYEVSRRLMRPNGQAQ